MSTLLPENIYAVILAGGSGTRFWPKSRHLTPKQLCAIGSDKTMLETTLERLNDFIPPERRMIVTHKDQVKKTREVAGSACNYYLAEPEARNTANALALAAVEIEAMHPGPSVPIMISLHADAIIKNESNFKMALLKATQIARQDFLAILGVTPQYPETGYGYIEKGNAMEEEVFQVKSFREKPDNSLAEEYLKSGNFYWNAGIFTWKISVFIEELSRYLPQTIEQLHRYVRERTSPTDEAFLAAIYKQLPKISIDNALLEVSKNVAMVEADIGWQDIGSWDALAQCFPTDDRNNLIYGDAITIDCYNNTIDTDGPTIAALGIENMVIVSSGDAILVCPKEKAQDVKRIVDELKQRGRVDLI